jgi:GNAT superfamily N-acetyltransferase
VELCWIDPDRLDDGAVDGVIALMTAAQHADVPGSAPYTRVGLVSDIRQGWDGDPTLVATTRDKRGRVVGVLMCGFSSYDNEHIGFLEVTVDPTARGHGLGRQLLESGIDRVRADGKSLVLIESYDTPAAVALGTSLGFERALTDLKRRQDLVALDWPELDRAHAGAVAAAADYELVRLAGPTPEALVPDVLRMTAAINDAPLGDLDVEDEVFTMERLRAQPG